MRSRSVPVLGIAFVGDENADTEATIVEMGQLKRLGHLPHLAMLNAPALAGAFAANFRVEDFSA